MDRHIELFPSHDSEAYKMRVWVHDNLGNHEAAEQDRQMAHWPPTSPARPNRHIDDIRPWRGIIRHRHNESVADRLRQRPPPTTGRPVSLPGPRFQPDGTLWQLSHGRWKWPIGRENAPEACFCQEFGHPAAPMQSTPHRGTTYTQALH